MSVHHIDPAWIVAICAVAGTGGALLAWGAKHLWKFFRRVDTFLDDYMGSPARPGFEARPGLMERVQRVEYQLHNNGGSTVKDAADRTEAAVTELRNLLNDHIEKSDQLRLAGELTAKEMWAAIHAVADATPADKPNEGETGQ